MVTFICYERCSTCQKAQKWLDANGIEYRLRAIREEKPAKEELKAWSLKSGLPARKFFNTSGQLYRSLGISARLSEMTEEEMFDLLATDGMLVKRPLLITEEDVLPGFREEAWSRALHCGKSLGGGKNAE